MDKQIAWWEYAVYGLVGAALLVGMAAVIYVIVVMPLPQTTIYSH